jgi:hypothetical protein
LLFFKQLTKYFITIDKIVKIEDNVSVNIKFLYERRNTMTTKEFYDKLAQDAALAEKFKTCKTPDAAYAMAKDNGCSDAMDAFVKVSEELNAKYKEMSPEEVDSVTAAGTETTATTVTTVTASASAVCAAV